MNVSLTPELESKVEERVATGLDSSASELVREALRLFFQFDEIRRQEVEELNRRIALGLAQLDRGEGIPGEESRARSLARVSERTRADS